MMYLPRSKLVPLSNERVIRARWLRSQGAQYREIAGIIGLSEEQARKACRPGWWESTKEKMAHGLISTPDEQAEWDRAFAERHGFEIERINGVSLRKIEAGAAA